MPWVAHSQHVVTGRTGTSNARWIKRFPRAGRFYRRLSRAIIALAARHRVPTIYGYCYFTAAGGLISYGVNSANTYRRAATYVDRILKGEKPADLPVQQPVQFELVVKLGLDVPLHLQQLADEVIE
ncbi:MAG: ABC transporter substrate binding protein [Pseudolabrys sp.]